MEDLFSRPEYNDHTAIKLKVSDGATCVVVHDNPELAFLLFTTTKEKIIS